MKNIIWILILFVFSQFLFAGGIPIAIMDLEPVVIPSDKALIASDLLRVEFVKIPVFNVIERKDLIHVLSEQELQLSGLTNAGEVVEMGKILNVKKILLGSMAKYEGKYVQYVLTIRMVDVETGSVEMAESMDIANDDELRKACQQIALKVAGSINLVGEVALLEGEFVYTNLGSDVGLQEGEYLEVFDVHLVKDKQGKILMREENVIAYLEITTVDAQGCKCIVKWKQKDVAEGMNIRRSASIPETEPVEKTSISFISIPGGAKAYIDGEFIGITPVILEDFQPGNYFVEMRYPGHRSYAGKIHLTEGRQITVERELEKVVEVEDMMDKGKILRKTTDPQQALAKSFLPGAGQFYNKYETTGMWTTLSVFLGMSSSLLYTYNYIDESNTKEEGDYDEFYSYVLDYKITGKLINTGIIGGFTLLTYISSILESTHSASSPFKYNEYTEIKFGPFGIHMNSSQYPNSFTGGSGDYQNPELDEKTASMSGLSGGGFISAGLRSRYLNTLIEFYISPDMANILGVTGQLKIPVMDSLSLSGGCAFLTNMEDTMNVEYAKEDPVALLRELTAITLGIAFETPSFHIILDYSPLAFGVSDILYTYSSSQSYTENLYLQCLMGMYVRGRIDYYFNARFGISLDARYIWFDRMIDTKALDAGLPVFNSNNTLLLSITPVFRF